MLVLQIEFLVALFYWKIKKYLTESRLLIPGLFLYCTVWFLKILSASFFCYIQLREYINDTLLFKITLKGDKIFKLFEIKKYGFSKT